MKDRIALVTGGSRGIGRAICLALATRGAKVVACARSGGALEELAAEVRKLELAGEIDPRVLDVTDRAAIDPFVNAVIEDHDRIDILVNNAGITNDGVMASMTDDQFDDVLTTNLRSVFWLTRAVCPTMVWRRWGRIVNIGSISGLMGLPGQANYSASKAGLIGLTKALAKELGKRKITCNVLAPGFITTDMISALPDDLKASLKQTIPLGRFGEVEEVAEAAAFLASEEASYITGQVLTIDGGLHT